MKNYVKGYSKINIYWWRT